jgi:hypothetical protein
MSKEVGPKWHHSMKTIIDFKWQTHGSLRSLDLSQDGVCTDLLKKLGVKSLKRDLSNDTIVNSPLFSLAFKCLFNPTQNWLE